MNLNITTPYKRLIERTLQNQLVKATVSNIPSIPPGSNPFKFDAVSMGTDLCRGWMVMHAGYDNDHGLEEMFLVNTVTGQRFVLDLEATAPRWSEDVYFTEAAALEYGAVYSWTRDGSYVNWFKYATTMLVTEPTGPMYARVDNWLILLDVVLDPARIAAWIEMNEPSQDSVSKLTAGLNTLMELRDHKKALDAIMVADKTNAE